MGVFCNIVSYILLVCSVTFCIGVSIVQMPPDDQELPVAVSNGAHITPIESSIIYTTVKSVFFTIPDLPEPPASTIATCPGRSSNDGSCKLFKGLQHGVNDINELLVVYNRILTTKGLGTKPRDAIQVPKQWIRPVENVEVQANKPTADMMEEAGDDWFSETETQLLLRKLMTTPFHQLTPRQKRFVWKYIPPLLNVVSKVGLESDIFKNLFVPENSILSYITNLRLLTKDEYKGLASISKNVSELQVETKRLLIDVLNNTAVVKDLSDSLQHSVDDFSMKIGMVEDSFLLEQRTLADLISNVYTSLVYFVHFHSFEECRNGLIPVAFVPESLLVMRLQEAETQLPDNIRFSIPIDNIQYYYKMKLAKCVFDSSGGFVSIDIPLVEKDSKYKLYTFRAIPFAHNDQTCALENPPSLFIKEANTNKIFVVSDLDQEKCPAEENGLCFVPTATSDDAPNLCMTVLLSSEPASQIKKSCILKCFNDNRPTISQLTIDTWIGTHLPGSGEARLKCPGQELALQQKVPNGAVRFKGTCNCQMWLGNTLTGTTKSTNCDASDQAKLSVVMPLQMTVFEDLLGSEDNEQMFTHAIEIYNPEFNKDGEQTQDSIVLPIAASMASLDILQSVTIIYLLARIHSVAGIIAAILRQLRLVNAHPNHTCNLPSESFWILVTILTLVLFGLAQRLFAKLYNAVHSFYFQHVEDAAVRIALDEKV